MDRSRGRSPGRDLVEPETGSTADLDGYTECYRYG